MNLKHSNTINIMVNPLIDKISLFIRFIYMIYMLLWAAYKIETTSTLDNPQHPRISPTTTAQLIQPLIQIPGEQGVCIRGQCIAKANRV